MSCSYEECDFDIDELYKPYSLLNTNSPNRTVLLKQCFFFMIIQNNEWNKYLEECNMKLRNLSKNNASQKIKNSSVTQFFVQMLK